MYSWHQSHDQATILLTVPYGAQEEDVIVRIERNYLLAGIRGQPPILKGRLYGNIDASHSIWQLEPRPRSVRLSARERATSMVSTASNHSNSSYAFVSDPEISSSLAASLESGQVSDVDEPFVTPSNVATSPLSGSVDEQSSNTLRRRRETIVQSTLASRSVSPGHVLQSITSSFSSLESLPTVHSGRLLTLHLEKEQSIIWPSLITGPYPESLSPVSTSSVVYNSSQEMEHKYNMDPTSLCLFALELYDIRGNREEAFECFIRAWHQARPSSATIRLVNNYLPLNSTSELADSEPDKQVPQGTLKYYFQCIGGSKGLAQLYLQAGLLHLDGAASVLPSSSLSSLRLPSQDHSTHLQNQLGQSGVEAWRRDREAAAKYFDRARILNPNLDVPMLPPDGSADPSEGNTDLLMPSLELPAMSTPESNLSESIFTESDAPPPQIRRRQKKREELAAMVDEKTGLRIGERRRGEESEEDAAWYLYIPGLVGAGTALLVVGVVGALSFSSWRRNQSS